MKIAIIECDTPAAALVDKFGTYSDYFKTLLAASVAPSEDGHQELEYVSYNAVVHHETLPRTERELEGIDGVLFTGSRYNSYDDDAWILSCLDLIRLCYHGQDSKLGSKKMEGSGEEQGEDGKRKRGVKMVGICFGHQLLARALGGQVGPNPRGWEIAVTSTTTFECGLMPSLQALRLQQMHRDVVLQEPPGSRVIGGNEICAIQALYEPGRYFSVQGHPEYNPETVKFLVQMRMEQGIVPVEYARDALARADLPHDGLLVGKAIVDFFASDLT